MHTSTDWEYLMATRKIVVLLVVCAAAISATTLPEGVQEPPPALALFVQASPAQYGKPLSLVFEVTNQGVAKIELDHKIWCGRSFLGVPDEVSKEFGAGNNLKYDERETYMVWFHLATPLPKGGFLQIADLRIFGGPSERTFIEPGKSFLYRIDLTPQLKLQGACEIYFLLIRNNHEVARSETAKIDVARWGNGSKGT
jgi:hypothetical protein